MTIPTEVWTQSMDTNHGHGRNLLLQSSVKTPEKPTLLDLKRNLNYCSLGQDTQEFLSTRDLNPQEQEHLEKLLSNTVIQLSLLFPASPCLFWKGAKSRQGYAKHHKCGVVACINPDHLEAIPADENLRLGNPLQTYCQATWKAAA